MNKWIQIHSQDNVAVALEPLPSGYCIETSGSIGTFRLTDEIPQGHKFALCGIEENGLIIKYGAPIGLASAPIHQGSHVHSHNLKTALRENDEYIYQPEFSDVPEGDTTSHVHSFQGFVRKNHTVGIRNEIWIVPTVGCVNSVGQKLAHLAKQQFGALLSEAGNIEDIVAFQHPYGCSQLGDDQENTRKILASLCSHPNAGGVLLLGLGCENSGIEEIKAYISDFDEERIHCLVCQEEDDEIAAGLVHLEKLIHQAARSKRTSVPISRLVVGVKCGGSDGLSGITANPLTGRFTDWLTAQGGSILMTEVPEMFGAETILLNRCENRDVFEKASRMIQNFKNYFSSHGQPVYENPSPGNKAGGITTLEDKSLGCTQKSGSALVRDVLDYAQPLQRQGLSLLYAPGNDLVSSTALAASGAHMVLFTTGRGTPFACPVPTVKISSNSLLNQKKNKWIDFNAGILTETADYETVTEELCRYVLQVANGQLVRAEEAGYHDMAIFKQNITL